jgi:uncharacterized membrane protein (DUF373 family)
VRRRTTVDAGIGRAESSIYVVVATLLVAGVAFIVAGTITDLIEGSASRAIADAGVFLLDGVLLLFIIAELLYTLRVVNLGGRILVEPSLFIGLIAIVRKVLVRDRRGAAAGPRDDRIPRTDRCSRRRPPGAVVRGPSVAQERGRASGDQHHRRRAALTLARPRGRT